MGDIQNNTFDSLSDFLLTESKITELEKRSNEIDAEIQDSKRILEDAKRMYDDAISVQCNACVVKTKINHEDLSKFLKAPPPNYLLPDMEIDLGDLDINESVKKIKEYIEIIKKTISLNEEQKSLNFNNHIVSLDLEQCAVNLQQMIKRVTNILNVSTNDKLKCNKEFEDKFSMLCQDVELFTKMIETKAKMSECSEDWSNKVAENTPIIYEEIISKLVGTIHELLFLFENIK